MISICDSNNSLPKQGGLGWVSLTLHRKRLFIRWLYPVVNLFNVDEHVEDKAFLFQNVSLRGGMIWQFENMFVYLPPCC